MKELSDRFKLQYCNKFYGNCQTQTAAVNLRRLGLII